MNIDWSFLYKSFPEKVKVYINNVTGEVSDFIFKEQITDGCMFYSPSTKIEISVGTEFNDHALSLEVWLPNEDPTSTDHQLLIMRDGRIITEDEMFLAK